MSLRALPLNDAHDGPFTIRVDVKPSGSAYVYVRCESNRKTWLCIVRTLQEILAPSQQARSLDFVAIAMCRYHGVAYDASSAFETGPLELQRREVAFSQPESWSDDGYRLTMRMCVRSTSIATPIARALEEAASVSVEPAAVGIVDVAEDDIGVGLNFERTDVSFDHAEPKLSKFTSHSAGNYDGIPELVRAVAVAGVWRHEFPPHRERRRVLFVH